jgi:hypothetical protein
MYQDLHFYIELDWEKYTENETEYLKKVGLLVDFAYQYKANVYYSKSQLIDFTENCEDLNLNFSKSEGNILDVILAKAIELKQQNFTFEVYFASEKTSLKHNLNLLVSALQNHEKQIVLSSSLSQNAILRIESNTEFERINIAYLDDIQDIRKWIADNSPKRKYNFSSKHGNSTTKAIPPKSDLKVSELRCTNEEAQQLLETSILDLREKPWCYNFDEKLNTFIVFPFEGDTPQNQFHAFHVEKDEWKKEIPLSIRKFFKK